MTNLKKCDILVADESRGVFKVVEKTALARIRNSLEKNIGCRVKLVSKKGRKKSVIRHGIIEKTYPSIFIVRLVDKDRADVDGRMVSFSYTDVLTRAVELGLYRNNNENNEEKAN